MPKPLLVFELAEKLNAELPYPGVAVFVWLEPNGLAAAGVVDEPNIELLALLVAGVGDEKLNADDC